MLSSLIKFKKLLFEQKKIVQFKKFLGVYMEGYSELPNNSIDISIRKGKDKLLVKCHVWRLNEAVSKII